MSEVFYEGDIAVCLYGGYNGEKVKILRWNPSADIYVCEVIDGYFEGTQLALYSTEIGLIKRKSDES